MDILRYKWTIHNVEGLSHLRRPTGGFELVGLWSFGFQLAGLLDWARSSRSSWPIGETIGLHDWSSIFPGNQIMLLSCVALKPVYTHSLIGLTPSLSLMNSQKRWKIQSYLIFNIDDYSTSIASMIFPFGFFHSRCLLERQETCTSCCGFAGNIPSYLTSFWFLGPASKYPLCNSTYPQGDITYPLC